MTENRVDVNEDPTVEASRAAGRHPRLRLRNLYGYVTVLEDGSLSAWANDREQPAFWLRFSVDPGQVRQMLRLFAGDDSADEVELDRDQVAGRGLEAPLARLNVSEGMLVLRADDQAQDEFWMELSFYGSQLAALLELLRQTPLEAEVVRE